MTWTAWRSGANRQVGSSQMELLAKAVASESGQIMVDPKDNRLWCAAKRLHQRGLLERHRFGGEGFGWITVYTITDAGRRKYRETR